MKAVLLAAAIACLSVAVPAAAESWQVGSDHIHVVARGVDPSTAAGRATFLAMVDRAAAKLCRDVPIAAEQRACAADTIALTARAPGGAPLRLAMAERDHVEVAAR